MMRSIKKLSFACSLAALLVGCSAEIAVESSEQNLTDNTDVQVVSAESLGIMVFGTQDRRFDELGCTLFDVEPSENQSGEYTHTAKADCTDMVSNGLRLPMVNSYIEPLVWVRMDPDPKHVTFRHWCTEVELTVAVKAAAWDSPSFEGIGFYARDSVLNQTPESQLSFFYKDDPRLVRVGEAQLKNEKYERVYLYRFAGAGPCGTHGTGQVPSASSLELKPYMQYEGGYVRWEAVSRNHGIRYLDSWDRSDDLLR